jgi:hypothetical protein
MEIDQQHGCVHTQSCAVGARVLLQAVRDYDRQLAERHGSTRS